MALLLAAAPAQAHDGYANWINKADRGCCNNQDCNPIGDEHVRQTPTATEVFIENQWCQVLPYHYLKTGNAPDWSTAHICVQKVHYHSLPGTSKCFRLLCFQPKPMM